MGGFWGLETRDKRQEPRAKNQDRKEKRENRKETKLSSAESNSIISKVLVLSLYLSLSFLFYPLKIKHFLSQAIS